MHIPPVNLAAETAIYLIGPSGVGKTSYAKYARSVMSGVKHFDVDELCKGKQFNWSACCAQLESIRSYLAGEQLKGIIDIGAGTQTRPELREYLAQWREAVILVYATADEVINRNPLGPQRDLAEFRSVEYDNRRDLYSVAEHTVDVSGKSLIEAEKTFVEYLLGNFQGWELKSG
jgi:hypothetical protein